MAHIAYSTQQRMASAFPKSLMFKGSEFEVYEEGEILDDGPERIPQYLNMITSTSMEMLGSKYCRRFDNSWVKGSEAIQREGFGRFGSEAFQSEGFGRFCVGESSGYANSKEVGWNENFLPLSDSNFDTTAWAQAVRKRSYFHKDELGLQAFAKRRRLEISSRGLNINVSKGIQYNLKGSSAHHAFSFGRNLSLARKGLGNNYSQSYMLLDKNERTSCEMCRTVHSQASCSLMGPIYGNCEVKDEAITNIKGLNTGYLSFGVCLNGNQEMPEKGVRNEVGSVIGESKTLNHKVKVTGTLNMVKGTDRSSVVIPDCNINATSSSKIKFALKHFSLLVSDCNSDASCTMNTDKIVQRNELKEVDHKDILTQKERIGISSSLAKPSSCKQESTIRSLSENDKSRIEEWHSKFQARRLQKKVERGLCYLKIRQKKQFSNQQASQQKLGCSSLAEEFLAGAVNADRSLVEVFQKLCKVLLVFEEICSSESTVWKGLWNMIHAKLSIAVYHTFHEIQFLFKAQEITTEKEQQLDEETLRRVLELAYDFCEKLLRLKQIPELECTMQIIQGILGNAEFVGSSKQGQVFILMQSLIKDILQEIESQMEELSTSIAIDTMPIENSKSEDSVKSEVFTSTGADEDIAETDLPKVAPAISTVQVDLAEFDSHSCTSFSCTEVDDAKSSTRVEYSYNQRLSDEESSDSQQRGDCSKTLTADLPLEDPYNNKKLLWKQDFQRRSLEQDRMLHAGKLCLVLDLDHTLLNSAKFSEIEPEWKHKLCAIQSKYRSRHGNGIRKRELHCCTNLGMWTKLRPGIWRFLAKASELYELHLYTMGNKVYATQMAKLLDPTGELFAGRIISKGDDDNDKQAKIKNLNGVLGMESAVLIVDDSARVWPFHRENLIGVERYMYFPCTRRQFGLPGPSLLEAGRDEREVDGMLLSTLAVLTKIHKAFFERCPLGERPDVRGLLAAEQQRILQGCGIVFSRVFPHGESQPQLHPLWQLAEQFGAKCSTSTDNSTTHIVAVSLGTDKIRWARANGRYVVNRQWLEASAVLYRRANEKHFPVTAHPRASAVLYRRSNEKQFPGTSPDRIDQRASSTTT